MKEIFNNYICFKVLFCVTLKLCYIIIDKSVGIVLVIIGPSLQTEIKVKTRESILMPPVNFLRVTGVAKANEN